MSDFMKLIAENDAHN